MGQPPDQPALNLGSAADFNILAGAEITTTDGGLINGDVGASPITGAAIHRTPAAGELTPKPAGTAPQMER